MELKRLMLETCKVLTPVWNEIGRRDRALADQGRRAMQSVVLQYAEGLHAHGGSRRAKLLGARSEAHEARVPRVGVRLRVAGRGAECARV